MTWRFAALVFALLSAPAVQAHPEYFWPVRPTLTDAQMGRIAQLVGRARGEFPRLPAAQRRSWAIGLASELAELGRCRRAEEVLEGVIDRGAPLVSVAIPAAADADRQCADRFITAFAGSRTEPRDLYVAGGLWRRIGERDKGAEAIAQAEAMYAAEEARDPDRIWACHGGNCVSRLWATRLHVLRMYHGTRLHRAEMSWLASLAMSHWDAREADRPAPYIGQRVFDELLIQAVQEGYDRLARTVSEYTVYGAASYPAIRMALLLRRGRVAEAIALWPEAASYRWSFEPTLIRENPAVFHPWRARFREWISFRHAPEALSVLPMGWLAEGDHERAREALAPALADLAAHPGEWEAEHIASVRAAEALLDSRDPVADLAARLHGDPLTLDYALAESAAGLAAAGRGQEARRALRRISRAGIRLDATARLPCRAAPGGEAAALMAVRIATPVMQLRQAPDVDPEELHGGYYQTLQCLFRHRRVDAALAYAVAVRDPERKLNLLVSVPLNNGADDDFQLVPLPPGSALDDELAVRRRFATVALAHVRRHDLWDQNAVASLAADFERLGQFATVDEILRRVRDDEIKGRIYRGLLRSYGRDRVRARPTP